MLLLRMLRRYRQDVALPPLPLMLMLMLMPPPPPPPPPPLLSLQPARWR